MSSLMFEIKKGWEQPAFLEQVFGFQCKELLIAVAETFNTSDILFLGLDASGATRSVTGSDRSKLKPNT